ncbi:MAG: hypothetical protein QGF30_02560 [Alphaproteobacteria bacterium]|nr:hypothetical protein [Alphaproteobacteria bacterium]MDP6781687.1 hypothetical protein [Alphaproteobacteria bacterium]
MESQLPCVSRQREPSFHEKITPLAISIVPHEGEPRLFGERRIFVVHR